MCFFIVHLEFYRFFFSALKFLHFYWSHRRRRRRRGKKTVISVWTPIFFCYKTINYDDDNNSRYIFFNFNTFVRLLIIIRHKSNRCTLVNFFIARNKMSKSYKIVVFCLVRDRVFGLENKKWQSITKKPIRIVSKYD